MSERSMRSSGLSEVSSSASNCRAMVCDELKARLSAELRHVRPAIVKRVEADVRRPGGLCREQVVEQRMQRVVEIGPWAAADCRQQGIEMQWSRSAS